MNNHRLRVTLEWWKVSLAATERSRENVMTRVMNEKARSRLRVDRVE
jgi:hypothetical protein